MHCSKINSNIICLVFIVILGICANTCIPSVAHARLASPAPHERGILLAAQTTTKKNSTANKKKNTKTKKKTSKSTAKNKAKKNSKNNKQSKKNILPAKGYKSAVLFNAKTGKTVFSNNPNQQIPPASLTKILSMYVALDTMKAKKISPNTIVTVSAKAAAARGSRLGLQKGDKVSLDHLLRGMAVSSGNDASIALAEFIGGNERNFVNMMNKKAKAVGMKRSVFKNANGLPAKGQFTTASDMLALTRSYLRAYPENLKKYHSHRFNLYKGRVSSTNANPLLGQFAGADGLKTGYVDASGYNLIATAKRGDVRIIGVILGAPTSGARAREARDLMEAGFGKLAVSVQDKDAAKKGTPKDTAKKNDDKKNSKKDAATSQKATGKSTTKAGGKTTAKPTTQVKGKPTDKATSKNTIKPSAKATANPNDKATNKPAAKPSPQTAAKPTAKVATKNDVKTSKSDTAKKSVTSDKKATVKSTAKTTNKPAAKPASKNDAKVQKESTPKQPAKATAKPANNTTARGTSKATAKSATTKPANKPTAKPSASKPAARSTPSKPSAALP